MAERRGKLQLAPCGVYDIEGTETWLEEQEAQGWALYSIWAGIARFSPCPPRAVRYRLETGSRRMGMEETVDRQTADFYAQQGWHYTAVRGPFAIYRCADPSAPELDTDPRLQAAALGKVVRREAWPLALLVVCLQLLLWRWRDGSWALTAISDGLPLFLLQLGLVLWFVAVSLLWLLRLGRLRKSLAAGVPLRHRSDWRRRASRRFVAVGLAAVLVAAYCVGMALRSRQLETLERGAALPDDLSALPFATLTDLAGGDRWVMDSAYPGGSEQVSLSGWIAPVALEFDQTGTVYRGEEAVFSGSLHVNYYETASPLVARALLRAWQAKDQRIWEGQGAYAPLVLPELGAAVDQAAAYEALLPTLLLTDGDRMIRVSLQSFDQTLPFDRWAPAAAAAFSAGGGA